MKIAARLPSLTLMLCLFSMTPAMHSQSFRNDTETTVVEAGSNIQLSYDGKHKVNVAIVVANPHTAMFASRPAVRVTVRAKDGAVITTRDVSSAGIPPKGRIAFCESLYADEEPAKVEFRPLVAGYEPTVFKESEFTPFELIGFRVREDGHGRFRITGEIKNPYPGETGAWITILYRDEAGKLLGGISKWIHTIPAGDPTPFEMHADSDEIPTGTAKTEKLVFSHNNMQSSWAKLLRRE